MDYGHTRQTLIARIRNQNDDIAWEEFVESYDLYIYAIIRRMGVSAEDSKDIHQDVLLKIWNKLSDYKQQKNTRFRGWLSTVTINSVKTFFRSNSNESKRIQKLESYLEVDGSPKSEFEKIINEEWETFLTNKALENVEEVFRGKSMDVFHKSLAGQSVEDISKELGLEESSVYQLRARVKKSITKEITRLRKELG
ncbi:MAG: sigma-70 family RNA polymerase sigma factor [Lentisphaeraceae bacterium]|nr:sigma-70 family RNA polymerase sigma factor [Lentisphaeraceae bacterium]